MALGSWQGLYNAVILDLMAQQRERQLLLLMAISTHANPFGFAFPGRARQYKLRHCSKSTQLKDEAWLVENRYITVQDIEDIMTGQTRPFYQISPRVIYVREELQEYCEAVFDGIRDRDLAWEKKVGVILSSTKESQPESLTRHRIQTQNPDTDPTTGPDTEPAATRQQQKERNTTTMRNETAQSEAPKSQRRQAQDRKKTPPGGASGDEFDQLLSPTVDDEQIVQEIRHIANTTEYQARDAVATFTRRSIVHWMRKAAVRRQKGTLSNPGGWFFKNLNSMGERINPTLPNGQTYQDIENDQNSDDMEV